MYLNYFLCSSIYINHTKAEKETEKKESRLKIVLCQNIYLVWKKNSSNLGLNFPATNNIFVSLLKRKNK